MSKQTERGENLREVRETVYKKASLAVEVMNNIGINIKYRRYLDLENGAMPNQFEMHQITNFYGISLSKWMLGEESDNHAHCDTLEGLSPRMRMMFTKMLKAGADSARDSGIS